MTAPRLERLLEPVLTHCDSCPGWEVACFTDAEKATKEAAHAHHKHGVPLPTRQLSGGTWQEQAMDAIRQVAAAGREFTVFEALREFGIADPPNAKTALGTFSMLIHDMHVAHPTRWDRSRRPGTKRSAAAVWHRDAARCVEPKCRARVGAL